MSGRTVLTATALLILFACAYEAAVRWPGQLVATAPATAVAPRSMAVVDTLVAGEASASVSTAVPSPVALAPDAVASPTAVASAEVASPCLAAPLRFKALKTGSVFHHYVGTVDGKPASAELSWMRPDSAIGRCYLWRGGLEYQIETTRRRRPLVLTLSQEATDISHSRGTWQLAARPGPILRGTWIDSAGQRRSLTLREDYRQSVPYNIQTLTLTGGKPATDDCYASTLTRNYLHLRGNLRPAWQRVQAPSLAARKRRLLAAYERYGDVSYYLAVRLNDFNLLSYETFYENFSAGGPRQNGFENGLFDLTTGRPLLLASQLQPGYRPALRRLLTNRLRRDFGQAEALPSKPGDLVRLLDLPTPNELSHTGLVLTGAGLEGSYLPEDLYAALGPEADVYSIPYTLLIPYRELRPLVRPGTPLARMLQARGMW